MEIQFASVISICKKIWKKIMAQKFLFYLLPPLSNLHFCFTIENALKKLQIWSIFEKTMKEALKPVGTVVFHDEKIRKKYWRRNFPSIINRSVRIARWTLLTQNGVLFLKIVNELNICCCDTWNKGVLTRETD